MATSPVPDDGRQRLALIQRLWDDLQAARKDKVKYEVIADRLRREADAFSQTVHVRDSKR